MSVGGGSGWAGTLTFQLLILSQNVLKSKIPCALWGRGGRGVSNDIYLEGRRGGVSVILTFDAESKPKSLIPVGGRGGEGRGGDSTHSDRLHHSLLRRLMTDGKLFVCFKICQTVLILIHESVSAWIK